MSGPSFHLRMPPSSLFKFPPDEHPLPLAPPPANPPSFATPFDIPPQLYTDLLAWPVPVAIGGLYAVTVVLFNAINRRRGNKPWAISQTRAFKVFVIAHNAFLTVYSALTFIAMTRALRHIWPGRIERTAFGLPWPAFRTEFGLAGAADALCRVNGPRGMGNAAMYNSSAGAWHIMNPAFSLAANGSPDPTDLGRLWNEGLAFWGWWFYLSKFYEVLDTFIILAKGKRSSTLQTYHHTGAMACMWAGIRFMSSPIWMFAWINSGIHALMYTYYTLSAVNIRVPQVIKRTLTTMQISQFLMGFTFAAFHLFVSYTVPVRTPYVLTSEALSAVSAAASTASSAVGEVAAAAATPATVSTAVAALIKKLAYRAANEEGLAENVRDASGQRFGPGADAIGRWASANQTHFRDEWVEIPCIDTTGQSFAIWLNLVYLLPLTWLFVRFFIRSYTRRAAASSKAKSSTKAKAKALNDASVDAAKRVGKEVEYAGKAVENEAEKLIDRAAKATEGQRITLRAPNEEEERLGRKFAEEVMKKGWERKDSLKDDSEIKVEPKVEEEEKVEQKEEETKKPEEGVTPVKSEPEPVVKKEEESKPADDATTTTTAPSDLGESYTDILKRPDH